jgi:hypothetical protein
LRTQTWYIKRRARGWCVQRQDATSADSLHDRQEDAVARGIEIARRARGRLRIKDSTGRVLEEVDFSVDGAAPRRAS